MLVVSLYYTTYHLHVRVNLNNARRGSHFSTTWFKLKQRWGIKVNTCPVPVIIVCIIMYIEQFNVVLAMIVVYYQYGIARQPSSPYNSAACICCYSGYELTTL